MSKPIRVLAVAIATSASLMLANARGASDDKSLVETISALDGRLFDAYNRCDLDAFGSLLAGDLEFYHDQSGLSIGRDALVDGVRKNICGKVTRELVPGTLAVYPIANYGAVETGAHRFHHPGQENTEELGEAKFVQLWHDTPQGWKLSRVFSFDHKSIGQNGDNSPLRALLVENHIPSAAVAVVRNGEIGELIMEVGDVKGNRAPIDAVFNVASLAKPVVAMLTLKLVAQGNWNLDEPLAHYWVDPDVRGDPRHARLTTRHVLTHTTGFANWRRQEPDKRLKFEFDPGTKFQYSGEGFEYLRRALERKFRRSIDSLAEEEMFSPLRMSDTHFSSAQVDLARLSQPHDGEGNVLPAEKSWPANGADNLTTTIQDYARFAVWVLSGAGLPDTLYQEALTPHSQIRAGDAIGLGWELLPDITKSGDFVVLHTGKDVGASSLIMLMPKTKSGLIVFTNSDRGEALYPYLIGTYLPHADAIMSRAK